MLKPIASSATTSKLEVSMAIDSRENKYSANKVIAITAMACGSGIVIL
jgi:hypothetical protein